MSTLLPRVPMPRRSFRGDTDIGPNPVASEVSTWLQRPDAAAEILADSGIGENPDAPKVSTWLSRVPTLRRSFPVDFGIGPNPDAPLVSM